MPTTKVKPDNPQPVSQSWRLDRWASEFIVIAAGVVVALAANSLWGRWQDMRTEHAYLQQLRSDLDENASRLQQAIELETSQHAAASAAYQAIVARQVISHDSARAWLFTRRGVAYSDPRLLTGTVTALISTGDLRLVRNQSLRQSIAGYAARIREDRDEFDRFVERLQPAFDQLREIGFREHGIIADRKDYAPVVAAITGTPGPDVLPALDNVLIANELRTLYLQRMLETTQHLREQL